MTASLLSSGPCMGYVSATGQSPIFQTTPGALSTLVVATTPAARVAATVLRLMRSTDGGNTWSPVTIGSSDGRMNGRPLDFPYYAPTLKDVTSTAATQFYIDGTFSAGSFVFYAAQNDLLTSAQMAQVDVFPDLTESSSAYVYPRSMTPAQTIALLQARGTPLQASDIAGALTLYKRCRGDAFATLQVPSGATRAFDNACPALGLNRYVRVSTATVTSVVDCRGNSLFSAVSLLDASTVYMTGNTIVAQDFGYPIAAQYAPSDRPVPANYNPTKTAIADFTNSIAGIHGWTTQLEAAAQLWGYEPSTPRFYSGRPTP